MRDRDVMLLNLDAFDERRQLAAGRWDLHFVAFNPTERAIDTELIIPLAVERAATIAVGAAAPAPLTAGRYPIRLEPGELQSLQVVIPGHKG